MPGTARGCLQVSLCLSVTQDLLSTFGLDLLFLEGGFLRKSVSDFSLFSCGRRLHAAQVCCWESGWGARTWRGDSTYPVVTLPHLCPLLTSLWCLTSPLHSVCPVSEIHKCIHPHHRCEARQTCSGEGSPLPPKKKTTAAQCSEISWMCHPAHSITILLLQRVPIQGLDKYSNSNSAVGHKTHSPALLCAACMSASVFQVTIEAQGMESMLGENVLEGQEEPELMAGMSAIFFDVQLRPIVFFHGYTDLMAKVLLSSGEPTSVVKGNLLLMDHHQVLDAGGGGGRRGVTCLHTES